MAGIWFEASSQNLLSKHLLHRLQLHFKCQFQLLRHYFLVDLALGITARTVPQLNIFVVGFPIKIGVSFIVLVIMMAVMIEVMKKLFEFMIISMRDLMILLGGG